VSDRFVIRAVWASNVKRRDRWTYRVVSNMDGHLCRSYARSWCCSGRIRHLVVPRDAADDGWALGALLGSQRTAVPEKGAGLTEKRSPKGPTEDRMDWDRHVHAQASVRKPEGHRRPSNLRVTDILRIATVYATSDHGSVSESPSVVTSRALILTVLQFHSCW
jgi:hypothetical protein